MATDRPHDADRVVDARAVDGGPFAEIMAALDDLSEDESLLVINSFEPEPLYDVLEERGFAYETTNPAYEEWHVEITRA